MLQSTHMEEHILSGIRPSSRLHIGNYLGAIRQWIELQNLSRSFFMIADLHAITTPYDPKGLQQAIRDVALDYLAAGLDQHKATLFVQSHVPEHVELAWLLGTLIPFGDLYRMTQWKEKASQQIAKSADYTKFFPSMKEHINNIDEGKFIEKIKSNKQTELKNDTFKKYLESESFQKILHRESKNILLKALMGVNSSLINYPVLMAADILIYKATGVPVGEDQVQHVELARIIARKFNAKYGETFPEPKALLSHGKRVMSLTDPTKKMSKSDGSGIQLDDAPEVIKKKVMKAVTATKGGDGNPGVMNLFMLLKEFSDPTTYRQFMNEEETGTIKYSELKSQLAEDIARHLDAFRKKRAELAGNNRYLEEILNEGMKDARIVAKRTLKEVKEKMGLV
ncbi:MAG: tryptophan--tRNA ligase [Candidatus Kerfeldbacteria bacterium]